MMAALIGLYLVALAIINREEKRPKPAQVETGHVSSADDLSIELRRCHALGPQDSDNAHCRAIWAENGRRFFDLPPKSTASILSAPLAPSSVKPRSSNIGGVTP